MARRPGVTMTANRVPQVQALIRSLQASEVLVGIPSDDAARKPEPGETAGPINNATIGYIMQYGSTAANIPERPHLPEGVSDARDQIADIFEAGAKAILAGTDADVTKTLHRVGLVAQGAVRLKIDNGPFVALSEVTLRKRRAKGRTGTKPLIDTGEYRNAITYVVVER